jgi:hypothetical protein
MKGNSLFSILFVGLLACGRLASASPTITVDDFEWWIKAQAVGVGALEQDFPVDWGYDPDDETNHVNAWSSANSCHVGVDGGGVESNSIGSNLEFLESHNEASGECYQALTFTVDEESLCTAGCAWDPDQTSFSGDGLIILHWEIDDVSDPDNPVVLGVNDTTLDGSESDDPTGWNGVDNITLEPGHLYQFKGSAEVTTSSGVAQSQYTDIGFSVR